MGRPISAVSPWTRRSKRVEGGETGGSLYAEHGHYHVPYASVMQCCTYSLMTILCHSL